MSSTLGYVVTIVSLGYHRPPPSTLVLIRITFGDQYEFVSVLSHCLTTDVVYILCLMFHIQYWNERDMEWKGTGSGTFYDLSQAKQRMRSLSQQCDYCVRFRVDSFLVSS